MATPAKKAKLEVQETSKQKATKTVKSMGKHKANQSQRVDEKVEPTATTLGKTRVKSSDRRGNDVASHVLEKSDLVVEEMVKSDSSDSTSNDEEDGKEELDQHDSKTSGNEVGAEASNSSSSDSEDNSDVKMLLPKKKKIKSKGADAALDQAVVTTQSSIPKPKKSKVNYLHVY